MVGVTVTPGPTKPTLSCASTKLKAGQTLSCTVNVDEGPLPVTGTVAAQGNYQAANAASVN